MGGFKSVPPPVKRQAGSVPTGHELGVQPGSRLVAQTEPGWYERLPRGDRHVPAYRSRYGDDAPGPSRARLAQLVRQVRLLVILTLTLSAASSGLAAYSLLQ